MASKDLVKQQETIAGIFFFVTLLGLLFFVHVHKFIDTNTFSQNLYAIFNKADGVGIGTPVYVAGVQSGNVSNVELDSYYRAVMTLSLNKKMQLPTDTSAVIETGGLIGEKYIELVPGGEEDYLENNDTVVYTQDSLLLDELLDRFLEWMRIKKGNVEAVVIEGENK